VPTVTVISPSKGIKSLKELVARAKAGSISYASAGVGSATHWAAERLRVSAGFNAVHVPFRGAESLTEVVAGRVDFMCAGISGALGFLRGGQLIPLAVSTQVRSRALPDVPTTIELGYADSDYNFWMGMLVPAKTPHPIVERLYQETQIALKSPGVVEKFTPQGLEPMPLTPVQFDALIAQEIEANKKLVKASGMMLN
jgi:tripartite-type tricarboxylate transporter receptor subunit TctC